MILSEMIDKVAEDRKITKVAARDEIAYFFGADGLIASALKADGDVKLGDIGTLKLVHRAARKGRNPQTKQEILIPAKTTAGFKPSKGFAQTL